ncbi:MAG TPA: MipA/OmpV family protein [Burkholderiales bacterium]|nr:MipA/OmpV family protein [Burkholderiales bacterium]
MKRKIFLSALPLILLLMTGLAASARADQLPLWEAGLGATVLNFPDYRGSDERQTWVLPFPYLVYRGEFLQADERRMRGLFFKTDRLELDVSANGSVPVDSGENSARRGMPDLDATLEIGPALNVLLASTPGDRTRLELRMPVRAVLASDFSYVRQVGWVFQPHLNADIQDPAGLRGWKLGLLGGPLYTDRRYNRYFYAVDSAFATATRPAYSTGGGYGGMQFIAALSKRYQNFWVGGFLKWDQLNGAAFEESPLVRDKRSFAGGIAIAWILGKSKTLVEAPR